MKHKNQSYAGRGRRAARLRAAVSAIVLALVSAGAALAQQGPTTSTPIPDGDIVTVVKNMGLAESNKPVRDMIKNWRKPVKVIVSVDNNTNRLAWLQKVAPGVKLVPVHNNAEMKKEIVDADVQLGGECYKAMVATGKELRWVQQAHTGMEDCFGGNDVPAQLTSGAVVVTNTKRIDAVPIADHAIAMMMALTRGLDLFVKQAEKRHMSRTEVPESRLWEIQGRTMLVVGLGGIGTVIADMGHALGMKVIATRNSSHDGPKYMEYVGLSNELPALIGKADVVVVASPLTHETEHMFNAAMFSKMKKGALFINIAREGEVVNTDLAVALKSGQVGGAGLDGDPGGWPDNDPMYDAPNLIVTPHAAAFAAEATDTGFGEDIWVLMRENLRRYVNGDKLYSIVDPKLGY